MYSLTSYGGQSKEIQNESFMPMITNPSIYYNHVPELVGVTVHKDKNKQKILNWSVIQNLFSWLTKELLGDQACPGIANINLAPQTSSK